MTLYAQHDVQAKVIDIANGGCGQLHQRPVINGDPAEDFALDCPLCEAVLRGDNKPKILVYRQDPQTGRILNQERVPDADLQWSSTPETVPMTEDEKRTDRRFRETAQQQIEMMNALGTAIANGLQIPREMKHILQKGLPAETILALESTARCANGHDAPSKSAFCPQCGISMAAKVAIASSEEKAAPALDLARLHPQTLKKLCRERKLPDTGTKDELISRLAA